VSLYQKEKLGNKNNFVNINNGVKMPPKISNYDFISSLGLHKKQYILSVGRFVEEKGFDLLINAYSKTVTDGYQLVIAGDADHETAYSVRLRELAKINNVVLPGYVKGEQLQQLYTHSRLFILSSYNEGLPISLLEAMSYSLPVLASNIPANLQISLPEYNYFKTGDEKSLTEKIDFNLKSQVAEVKYDMTSYNWDQIALQTKMVYNQVLNKSN
jgi:glycosyltransferase involved in cell wall biosynthesis